MEHLQQLFLGHDETLKLLLLLDRALRDLFDGGIVGVGDGSVLDAHLVEETVVGGRAKAQVASIMPF